MESNTVLSKIMTLLSLDRKNEEVKLAYAKLADGTILESLTFDVGERVEIVSEDGTKTPAPDGEHELELTDESGNINRFKIFTEGGVITERENVELEDKGDEEKDLSEETIKVDKDIPQAMEKADDEELQEETEIVLQNTNRVKGMIVFFFTVTLAQILLVLKKKQFEKVQAAEMNF